MKMRNSVLTMAVLLLCMPGTAFAGDWYFGGSLGFLMQDDSDNSGAFTSDFTTGNGSPAVPDGTVLPSGTTVDWTTEFDDGMAYALEGGLRYDSGLRSGIELSYGTADVETHRGVTAGGNADRRCRRSCPDRLGRATRRDRG